MTTKAQHERIKVLRKTILDELASEVPQLTVEHLKVAEMRVWTHLKVESMDWSKEVEDKKQKQDGKKS